MTKSGQPDPNSAGYTNALLEGIEEKFQIISEATQPIPKMQEDIATMQVGITELQEMVGPIPQMQKDIAEMRSWEDDIKLIPAIFEEVGKLRQDVEVVKQAMQLIGQRSERLDKIEQRLTAVEQKI